MSTMMDMRKIYVCCLFCIVYLCTQVLCLYLYHFLLLYIAISYSTYTYTVCIVHCLCPNYIWCSQHWLKSVKYQKRIPEYTKCLFCCIHVSVFPNSHVSVFMHCALSLPQQCTACSCPFNATIPAVDRDNPDTCKPILTPQDSNDLHILEWAIFTITTFFSLFSLLYILQTAMLSLWLCHHCCKE